ncbi:energy-coupling factor ABC transporter permease [Rhodococcus tibetensis]|uniref:Energy-coupling factor ABC transporter permease n=1 Tax=Rhodococcus tibetensis TaxID=2965064 RepID=A0ABT1QM44_9NOCA|nr:energy-coupling factor ABC transporter permease [Rhodococcus sp. FXJ9.536]MCQ4122170.1 energy-coupling factor ABC transporter permease [Rhodococcus sp. FXJ9.536]
MHMSDGLINAPTSVLFLAVAVVGLSVATWRARSELDDRTAPMAGLVAAFIFAVQMVNFPVLPGVSGHLLGGALAAILVGPYTGALCISIVLIVQALLFADGGLTALGANITNMAIIGVTVGYAVALVLRRLARPENLRLRVLGGLAFMAAVCGTVAASMGFVLEFAIGGQPTAGDSTSLGSVAAFVLGAHTLIGIGEGLITAVTVTAVARARPDLVYLLRTAPRAVAVGA